MKGKITLFFTALCLGLAGCMTPPKGLEEERFSINSYREISPQDLTCHCKTVRLGGKIVQATVLPNRTKIEVLSLPVSSISGKPFVEFQSDGRFIVYFNGFVDPENLKELYIRGVMDFDDELVEFNEAEFSKLKVTLPHSEIMM